MGHTGRVQPGVLKHHRDSEAKDLEALTHCWVKFLIWGFFLFLFFSFLSFLLIYFSFTCKMETKLFHRILVGTKEFINGTCPWCQTVQKKVHNKGSFSSFPRSFLPLLPFLSYVRDSRDTATFLTKCQPTERNIFNRITELPAWAAPELDVWDGYRGIHPEGELGSGPRHPAPFLGGDLAENMAGCQSGRTLGC